MQIFNKSKRQFILSTGILKPEGSTTVSDAEGAKLLKMYDGELIQIGNSAAEKENTELKAKIAELEEIVTAPEKVKQTRKYK
jgi:DNA gyrase/topoisomerase IV subunit A